MCLIFTLTNTTHYPTHIMTQLFAGYRKGNSYENVDAFSRNNYVIVGSRTLHCEPPQVYQPTPEPAPPPPGKAHIWPH